MTRTFQPGDMVEIRGGQKKWVCLVLEDHTPKSPEEWQVLKVIVMMAEYYWHVPASWDRWGFGTRVTGDLESSGDCTLLVRLK